MGSWFSRESQCHRLAAEVLDWRTMSNFCGVYYGFSAAILQPYALYKDLDTPGLDINFDCYCCGTTSALTLRKRGEDLIIAQVGRSGALLGTRDKNNVLIPEYLTVDLEPNPLAAARKCTGRRDEPVLSAPFISTRRITDADEIVVLATGRVWEVLKKQQVLDIVYTGFQCDAARAIVQAAVRKWNHMYPTLMVDDCAVVCLFLRPVHQLQAVRLPLGKKIKRD
ncbi:putative protein phosphatase 2C 33 [Salvia divinorum]|uniref:PPM-type phosphatase domain-containing protein n=1 Tax=Salvia divinorum TaxID=28513 RepID=A0ABD1GEM7_SALDI